MDENTCRDMELLYRYKYMIENIRDIVWETDINLVFTFVSPTVKEMTGFEVEELTGRCILDFLSSSSREEISGQWKQKVRERAMEHSEDAVFLDAEFVCKDERAIWIEVSGKPVFRGKEFVGYIGTTRDISEKKTYEKRLGKYIRELKHVNTRLKEMATYDMLTGAYNRRKFEQYIRSSVDMKVKYNCTFSIIMFDIDYFKQINDRCGHNVGDQLLKEISSVVRNTLRETDKLFRWGGDEFIILLPGIALKDACKVAEKVRCSIEAYAFGAKPEKVTVSLGVGEYMLEDGIEQLVSSVDKAMLEAKAGGKNRVEWNVSI